MRSDPTRERAISNVILVSSTATARPDVTQLRSLFVPFQVAPTSPFGGHVSTSTIVNGAVGGIALRAFEHAGGERRAAQGVLDAISASGLLTAHLPANDWQRPDVGRSRIYLDRRSRFLEFDTEQPPASVQAVLAALTSYERIARAGGAAS